jgi:hypothetical protein
MSHWLLVPESIHTSNANLKKWIHNAYLQNANPKPATRKTKKKVGKKAPMKTAADKAKKKASMPRITPR